MKNLAGLGRFLHWSRVIQVVAIGGQGRGINFLMRYCLQVVVYAIWHERNIRRAGEQSQPASCLIKRLDMIVRNRVTSLRKKVGKHDKTIEIWFGKN